MFIEAGTEKVTANRRALELAGQPSVSTVASYRGQVCTPDGKPLPMEKWPGWCVLRGVPFETQEMLIRGPEGREVPVLLSAAPVFLRDGRPEGVVVLYEDISELKRLQRLREEWASIVTHDLRQPLNLITLAIGSLSRMAQTPDPQRLHKGLEQAKKAAHTLNRMISDLADVSRIETKHLTVERRPVDLASLTREVVERQRSMTPDRAIELDVVGAIPAVAADYERIEQVLGNLLVNALKYSDPGTPVQVAVRPVHGEVRVMVTNRGPGIPSEELPRLFDRYYRTTRARAGGARGLGLGLNIAKGLIEAHGGRIWAESRPGEATTFQFALSALREG